MSLINDALQRARQSQQQKPPPQPTAAAPFRPVEAAPPRSALWIVLPILIVVLAAVGGAFIWSALQKRDVSSVQARNADESARATATPQAQPRVAGTPELALTTVQPPAIQNAPLESSSAPVPVKGFTQSVNTVAQTTEPLSPAVDAPPAKPVLPKLQGVYYRPDNPSAVLDGKTVYVGNRVGDFRVAAITTDSVELHSAAQTNVLRIGE